MFFFFLQLECTELEEKYEEQNRKVEPDKHQQKIVALCQKYTGEEKSAKATTATYNSILKILVKVNLKSIIYIFEIYEY